MEEIRFDERVAIVTGAGGGLGRSYAEELARRGAKVVVNDLGGSTDGVGASSSMADETVATIKAAGGTAIASYDSVATPEGGAKLTQAALDTFGRVDIVINNAGILRDKSFANLDVADLEAVLDVHLRGAFFVTQPAYRVMKERGYGRILFTTSSSGIYGNFGQANYAAAKTGLIGLSNVIAIEGAKSGIQSNTIAPSASTRLGSGDDSHEPSEAERHMLDPRHVAAFACYLVSEKCALSHEMFAVGYGRIARTFIGLAPSWYADDGDFASLEDVHEHLDTIMKTDGFIIPQNIMDEVMPVYERLEKRSRTELTG